MNNTLQSWLETATHNLAPRAVTQISNEITAHVQSATAQHQLEGMGEELALELAVKQLGSAKSAARGYRRAHLTEAEFLIFRRGNPSQIMAAKVLIVIFTGIILLQIKLEFNISYLMACAGVIVINMSWLLAQKFKKIEQRALCQLIGATLACTSTSVGAFLAFDTLIKILKISLDAQLKTYTIIILLCLIFAFLVFAHWNLWRKTVRITSS